MISANPLVSVYITNYNYGAFIKESIESVLNQSLQNFELLIIDDGSTDNSKEIIENYRDHDKVKIIYQQNKGLNITNNIAMRAAKGKYLMRLDADDFLENDALKLMSDVLEENHEIGLIFPDYYYIDASSNRTGEEKRHDFEKDVSLFDQPAHGACTMIKLRFLRDLGGYNESFTCQDGYDLWIKFIMHYKITNINIPLFSYRQHGNNLTSNEHKILNTRKKIKALFVEEHLKAPCVLAIIPVRNTYIGDVNWPLYEIEGKTILERKVELCIQAKHIDEIIISSADKNILDFSIQKFVKYKNITVIERPKKFAGPNQNLSSTVAQALEKIENRSKIFIDSIITLALEYPFVNSDVIDDAVNTQVLFNSDSVLSVRLDNNMYYQHTGHGLKPILDQDKFTKLEREALYKGSGGIILTNRLSFLRTKKLVNGKTSHIVVDQKTAFGVFSNFDFNVFNNIYPFIKESDFL